MDKFIKNYYNKTVSKDLYGKYEYDRWFKTPQQKAGYDMTLKVVINRVLPFLSSQKLKILEVGPGPGTWTKLLFKQCPQAEFDLVDISKEMLKVAKEELFQYKINANFFEADFLDFQTYKKYDVFFSCRAIEYMKDKEKLVKEISDLLSSGGQGFIITKVPHYFRQRVFGKSVPKMHRDQITPSLLKKYLIKYGFSEIEVYPVITNFSMTFAKSLWGNWFLFNLFYKKQINFISKFFSESYLIKFKKF